MSLPSSARRLLLWVWSTLLLSACASAPKPKPTAPADTSTPAPTPIAELPQREDLPLEAFEVLSARMDRHGGQMSAMMVAVVLLDYEAVRYLASELSKEPMLGRPAAGDVHSLNASLPPSFFVHQDGLVASLRSLSEAANHTDDQKLVEAFGEVAKTCVGCHSAYLHEALVTREGEEHDLLPCDATGRCDDELEPDGTE